MDGVTHPNNDRISETNNDRCSRSAYEYIRRIQGPPNYYTKEYVLQNCCSAVQDETKHTKNAAYRKKLVYKDPL